MFKPRSIGEMMRCFLSTSNINKMDLYVISIKLYPYLFLVSHLGLSNILKNISYIEKSVISLQIILSKNIRNRKKRFVTVMPSIKLSQVMKKSYNAG